MINMVIADDESVIIKGIQKLIDWEKYGISIAGTYHDGKSALDGIISAQAEIALLDISMPKMSGIDVLKELNKLQMHTKIIFISGFQDFEYAKAAIKFGAKAYILKPIIRHELIENIQKCVEELSLNYVVEEKIEPLLQEKGLNKLMSMEESTYIPALLHIIFHSDSKQERKLIQFSVLSYLEKKMETDNSGIIFGKNGSHIIIFKGIKKGELATYLATLFQETREKTRHQIGMIIGREVYSMGEIPAAYKECQDRSGWFFFFSEWKKAFLLQDDDIFFHKLTMLELEESRKKLIELTVEQNLKKWEKQFKWYQYCIAVIVAGNREDAVFHFCTGIRGMQHYLREMGIGADFDMKELLEKGRNVEDFAEMCMVYKKYYHQCYDIVMKAAENRDKMPIIKAKKYIEEHYQENLSLEILAEYIHMNTYYFSSFFKKSTGMNFKEYLNEIRLRHAVSLMLSSDKNVGEIASEVGFCDMRAFIRAFDKKFGDTPGNYRKRITNNVKDDKA